MRITQSPILTGILVVAVVAILLPLFAEFENPNQKSLEEVTGEPPVSNVRANIVPLIWRAMIDDAVVAVPLRSVEYYGVQIYDTDSQTRVRELTICTESQSFIRIYHIKPFGTTSERLSDTAARLRNVAERGARQEWSYPFKQYPVTTHTHMVEYRVENEDSVGQLYDHLEAAMVEYHARDLVPAQRSQIMRQIEVKN